MYVYCLQAARARVQTSYKHSNNIGDMRAMRFLINIIVFHALSARGDDKKPFNLRIYTPSNDDFYVKTLAEDWTIDSHDRAYFSSWENSERAIPYHPKARYSVAGQITWTKPFSDLSDVRKRAFWVGKGDPNVPARDLLKVSLIMLELQRFDSGSAPCRREHGKAKIYGSFLAPSGPILGKATMILCSRDGSSVLEKEVIGMIGILSGPMILDQVLEKGIWKVTMMTYPRIGLVDQ